MKILRNNRILKINAFALSTLLLLDMAFATVSFALTGGPSQPEVASFTPVSTSDLVDLSSGDFNYNIPLLDVGGYPLNISYSSGISMDEEASWVGLGWNLNPGVVNRIMRSLPDDFNGLEVKKQFNMKDNITAGINLGLGAGLFGIENAGVNASLGVKYNNYNGIGFSQSLGATVDMGIPSAEPNTSYAGLGLTLTASDGGLNADASASFGVKKKENTFKDRKIESNVGLGFNSRSGLGQLTASVSGSTIEYDKTLSNVIRRVFLKGEGATVSKTTSGSVGTSMSLMPSTYTPNLDVGRYNLAATFSTKLGPSFFGADVPTANISAYYTHNKVKDKIKSVNSYGYLYAQNGQSIADQHDFNRENDAAFSKNVENLPVTNQTFDLFSVNGQGAGGTFRAYRNDIGVVYDARINSSGDDGSFGGEFGGGMLAKGGFDLKYNRSESHSGRWTSGNQALNSLRFENTSGLNELYEPSYFKQVGELAVDDEMKISSSDGKISFLEKIGGFDKVRVNISSSGIAKAQFKVDHENGGNLNFPSPTERFRQEDRKKRNQLFSYLTVEEASKYAIRPENLPSNVFVSGSSGTVKPEYMSQMGELSVTQPDGSRYIYGRPMYNTKQKEATFNVTDNFKVCEFGQVAYFPQDATISNDKGIDHYFQSSELPPFAHSFMITEILSTDYSDSDDIKGPSSGDFGGYTLFKYSTVSNYKWRSPYTDANYNEGFKSVSTDDKGSYIYGEKDLSYLEKIETKTHIAIFVTSPREDALEAFGEHPLGNNIGSESMRKLDQIKLYALPEYKKAIDNGQIPTPIKTVHFVYDYVLGSGINPESGISTGTRIPNNSGDQSSLDDNELRNEGGKLTLREVFFTYGNSQRARFSKYEFKYDNSNPAYNTKSFDVWGNYKKAEMGGMCNGGIYPSAPEYPYVKQIKSDADENAQSWHISEIILPSGGSIKVEFESDDYLHVQNKRVMQMFRVLGSTNQSNPPNIFSLTDDNAVIAHPDIRNELYNYGYSTGAQANLMTCIASDVSLSSDQWNKALEDLIGSNVAPTQFRFLTDVSNDGSYEYVSGYARVINSVIHNGSSKYAWVEFQGVEKENKDNGTGDHHPVSKATWNFARKFLPKKAYNLPEPQDDTGLESIVKALGQASLIGQLADLTKGPNGALKAEGKGRRYVQGRSWIRLNVPKQYKFGGGSRVKSIVSNDNWKQMTTTNHKTSQYGQKYVYTSDNGESSGVAAFEPLMSKENPWVQPINYDNKSKYTIPNYIERPLGVSFFPSPTVTYSKVKVSDIVFEDDDDTPLTNINTNGTGHAEHEFYTTKDFPTKTTWTDLESIEDKSGLIGNLLKLDVKNLMTVSQGYQVEINDMNGKPKSVRIFGQGQSEPISGVDYIYGLAEEENLDNNDPFASEDIAEFVLNNTVTVLDEKGIIKRSKVGVEVDMVTDFREQANYDHATGLNSNLTSFLAAIFPAVVPTALPTSSHSRTRFRSAVTTKVINRRGILRETRAFDNGASVSTKNLAYDANTGQVLLTATKNEFGDEIFNLNLPSYWAYNNMGQASQNIGYVTSILTSADGSFPTSNHLTSGDEVALLGTQEKAWVWNPEGSNLNYLIDKEGNPIVGYDDQVKVIRSGYKNVHESPMTSMTLMKNPLLDANGELNVDNRITLDETDRIIDVSAIEYSDKWKTFVAQDGDYVNGGGTICTEVGEDFASWINQLINDPNSSWLQDPVDLTDPHYNGYDDWYSLTNCPDLINCTNLIISNQINVPSPNASFVFECNPSLNCTEICSIEIEATDMSGESKNIELLQSISCLQFLPTGVSINGVIYSAVYSDGTTGYLKVTQNNCLMDPQVIFDLKLEECHPNIGDPVNPFVQNLRGQFRPINSYAYLGEREYAATSAADHSNIKEDGVYKTFNPFWEYKPFIQKWKTDDQNWTWTSSITEFNPYGPEVENINALYQHSAAIFGYNNTIPIAVGANTTYHQLAFDGFEDYDYYDNDGVCFKRHFSFEDYQSQISLEEAHTGLKSISIDANESVRCVRTLDHNPGDDMCSSDPVPGSNAPYELRACDALGLFGPETYDAGESFVTGGLAQDLDKRYVMSYWVKETLPYEKLLDYHSCQASIEINSSTINPLVVRESELIEGWKRYEMEFIIPGGSAGEIQVVFTNNAQQSRATKLYVDDIRIHPYDGSMKSYVYHPENLRLLAELDDNNFATFYEYDNEGRLLRIKKETERGIMTIQESRTFTPLSN